VGKFITTTQYQTPKYLPTISINILGNITRTNYDSEDNIIATTDAVGNINRYEYDKFTYYLA
jgi:YD repeat-containing protein